MTTTSTIPVGGILASAFSEILGAPVVTYDEYQQRKEESPRAQFQSLDIYQIFRLSYDWGTAEEERDLKAEGGKVSGLSHEVENLSLDEMSVCVKTLNGYTHIVRVGERDSVRHLKENIKERLGMPCEEQRLSFSGNVMDDDYKSISDYGVGPDSSVHMMVQSRSGMCPTTFIDNRSFDPAFDYDFTDKDDGGKSFYRGGERYYRPCGWMRRAIKVRGRFVNDEDGRDDKWLGEPGYREISSEGEWPVPYHGTPKENSDSITTSGYLLSKSQRFKYGRGTTLLHLSPLQPAMPSPSPSRVATTNWCFRTACVLVIWRRFLPRKRVAESTGLQRTRITSDPMGFAPEKRKLV